MSVNIYMRQPAKTYFVEWLDSDGYTRTRQFQSYRAAQRYAGEVERRLLTEFRDNRQSAHVEVH